MNNNLRTSFQSNQNSDDMNMDHLEFRDDDSDAAGDGNPNSKLRNTGLRGSNAQHNGDLTRFSGYRGSQMRGSQVRGSYLYSNMTPRLAL